jgi:hypothetical protein
MMEINQILTPCVLVKIMERNHDMTCAPHVHHQEYMERKSTCAWKAFALEENLLDAVPSSYTSFEIPIQVGKRHPNSLRFALFYCGAIWA